MLKMASLGLDPDVRQAVQKVCRNKVYSYLSSREGD